MKKNLDFHYLNIFPKQKQAIINAMIANVKPEEKYNLIMMIF